MPPDEGRSLMTAGASAGISAVFSSPAVGLLYGLEVPFSRDVDAPRLVPAAVASACAYAARVVVAGAHPLVVVRELPSLDAAYVAGCLLVGVSCGLGGRLFAEAQTRLQRLARRGDAAYRALGAGALLGALAWCGYALSGSWITLGPGHIATDWLLAPGTLPAAWLVAAILLIRTAGTLTCVYGGGGGGVFTALACTGAFVGALVARLLARDEVYVFPLIGAAAFLSAGYRIPLSCMLWVGEASGDLVLTLGGSVAVAMAQVFVGPASVSESKREQRASTRGLGTTDEHG
jgi:H+/Cl- antiporter ClcA